VPIRPIGIVPLARQGRSVATSDVVPLSSSYGLSGGQSLPSPAQPFPIPVSSMMFSGVCKAGHQFVERSAPFESCDLNLAQYLGGRYLIIHRQ